MNELETLLARAATDPAARPDFYRALADGTLFVLTPVPLKEGSRTLETGESVQIIQWLDADQQQVTPMFTSQERIDEAVRGLPEKYGYLGVRGRELFGILSQAPIAAVLNPNSDYGRTFLPEEIARLAEGTFADPAASEVVEQDRQVLVGQPREYPHGLVAALRRCFAGAEQVSAAYLALMVDHKIGPEPRLVITIESTGDAKSVVRDAGVIAREMMKDGPGIDFTVIDKGAEAPLSGGSEPFYTRVR